MSRNMRLVLSAVAILLGIVLIFGGIDTRKYGALISGIIVEGFAAQHFTASWKFRGGRG